MGSVRSASEPILFLTIFVLSFAAAVPITISDTDFDFQLTSFDVNLDLTNVMNGKFSGFVTIELKTDQKFTSYQVLTLDCEVTVLKVQLWKNGDTPAQIVRSAQGDKKYSIEFEVDSSIIIYKFILSFEGSTVRQGDLGLYVTEDNKVIGTSLYPTAAKKVFPCFEDPKYKVLSALSKVENLPKKFKLVTTPITLNSDISLPSYGLGFIAVNSSEYNNKNVGTSNKVTVWYNEQYDKSTWKTFSDAINVNYFTDMCKKVSCPTVVVVPGLNVSSQSYNLIGIRPDFIVENASPTVEEKKGILMGTLNAFSKYYLRIEVTPSSWNEFWISDSLSLYLQYAIADQMISKPEDSGSSLTLTEVLRVVMENDSSPVIPSSINPDLLSTDAIYNSVYKGAAVLMMLQSGNDVSISSMMDDIANFTYEFKNRLADTTDLLDTFTNRSFVDLPYDNNLNLLTNEWLHTPGYPQVTINVENGRFEAQQVAFQGYQVWHIPMNYMYNEEFVNYTWMIDDSDSVQVPETNPLQPVDINVYGNGIFRVFYDKENWEKLLNRNMSDDNKAAKLDDLFAFSWMKHPPTLRIVHFLEAFDQLGETDGYSTWSIAMKHFDTLYNVYFDEPSFKDRFQEMLSVRLYKMYNSHKKWRMTSDTKETVLDRLITRMVTQSACRYNVSSCFGDSLITDTKANKINSDINYIVTCSKLTGADVDTWESTFKTIYNEDDSQYSRADSLYSLACPMDRNINGSLVIRAYLDKILNAKDILLEDAARAYSYIYSHPENVNQSLYYLLYNYIEFSEAYSDGFVADILHGITPMLSTDYHQSLLRDFLSLVDSQNHSTVATAASQALDKLEMTMKMRWNHMDDISNWLGVLTPTQRTTSSSTPGVLSSNGTTATTATSPSKKGNAAPGSAIPDLYATALLAISALLLSRL